MWQYRHTDELYHYGIPGMKWGVRNSKAYKSAKATYKKARKAHFKSEVKRFGRDFVSNGLSVSEYNSKSGAKFIKSQKVSNKTYANKVVAKANLKAIAKPKTNKLGYNKAEFKTYVKGLKRSGIPNSSDDIESLGKGTTLYNTIARKKGKRYANKVLDKTSDKKANALIIGGLATIGYYTVKSYINSKDA